MSDNLRSYRAIRQALRQCYPRDAKGNLVRHLNTLAALISGIVASRRTHLPDIADEVPDGTKPPSRVKRFARWLDNDNITYEVYFLPYAEVLLAHLALQTLELAIDGSTVGRGCVALMISVIYKGRALPVAWLVRQGNKGHFPEDLHIALIEEVKGLIPKGAQVVLLGDGEFDGTGLLETLRQAGWSYVCRTGCNMTVSWDGDTFRLDTVKWCIKAGTLVALDGALFTRKAYGPLLVMCCWGKGNTEPWYLISNMASAEEACRLYAKRYRIETFFSDQKSRGFNIDKSHISTPERLSRLLIASCLAYIWMVYLGDLCMKDGWVSMIHRGDRCDLSLFRLGRKLLKYFLNEGLSIPVAFHLLIE